MQLCTLPSCTLLHDCAQVFAIGGADGFEPGQVFGGAVPFLPDAFDRATVIEKYGADCLKTDADNVLIIC